MYKYTLYILLFILPFSVNAQNVVSAQHGAEPEHVDAAVQQYAAKKGIVGPVKYDVSFHDINTDSRRDAIVLVTSDNWCETSGCTMLVLEGRQNSFFVVSSTQGVSRPVRVLPHDQRLGWQSLIVSLKGKGDILLRAVNYKYPIKMDKLVTPDSSQLARAKILIK